MKKFRFLLMATLLCCTSITAFGQNNSKSEFAQQALDAHEQKIVYRAQLAKDVVGWRMGAEYSLRHMLLSGAKDANKHGVNFLGGYRFTKRLYLGGIAGVAATTPFTIVEDQYTDASGNSSSYNYEIDREDKIYGVLMADVRFYTSVKKVSTYLFVNGGVEYSKELQKIVTFGLGFDVHTKKSQSVNIGLGIGMGGCHSADDGELRMDDDPGYGPVTGPVLNLKLGYTF